MDKKYNNLYQYKRQLIGRTISDVNFNSCDEGLIIDFTDGTKLDFGFSGSEGTIEIKKTEKVLSVFKWMKSSHYHCKKCEGEIKFLTRLNLNVYCDGVMAIGICSQCNVIMVEYEKKSNAKWISLRSTKYGL